MYVNLLGGYIPVLYPSYSRLILGNIAGIWFKDFQMSLRLINRFCLCSLHIFQITPVHLLLTTLVVTWLKRIKLSSYVLHCSGLRLSVQRVFVLSVCVCVNVFFVSIKQKVSETGSVNVIRAERQKGSYARWPVIRNFSRSLDREKRPKQMIRTADVKYQP